MADFLLRQKVERALVEMLTDEGGSVFDGYLRSLRGKIDLSLMADKLIERFGIKEVGS